MCADGFLVWGFLFALMCLLVVWCCSYVSVIHTLNSKGGCLSCACCLCSFCILRLACFILRIVCRFLLVAWACCFVL